jgi:hypothetical protein
MNARLSTLSAEEDPRRARLLALKNDCALQRDRQAFECCVIISLGDESPRQSETLAYSDRVSTAMVLERMEHGRDYKPGSLASLLAVRSRLKTEQPELRGRNIVALGVVLEVEGHRVTLFLGDDGRYGLCPHSQTWAPGTVFIADRA